MNRSIMSLLVALSLATAAIAEEKEEKYVVVPQGQFYHRAGHLQVDVWKLETLKVAVANGMAACPECTPPKLVDGKVRDAGPSPYFQTLAAATASGAVFSGPVTGRVPKTSEVEAARASGAAVAGAPAAAASFGLPGGAAAAAAAAPAAAPVARAAAPAASAPAQPAAIPGTGGLLRPLQFSNSPFVPTSVNYTGQPIEPPR
jgi:hypothetical protein